MAEHLNPNLGRIVTFDDESFKAVPEQPVDGDHCAGCSFSGRRDSRCSDAGACAGVIFIPIDKAVRKPPMILSEDPAVRKSTPITTGVLDYFPRAIAAVAHCSKVGNDQHNPGQPLHWTREKSTDHADCISRHLIDRNTVDTDGVRHAAKLAWRALALLETLLEAEEKRGT
jgi:hypothetical protein